MMLFEKNIVIFKTKQAVFHRKNQFLYEKS